MAKPSKSGLRCPLQDTAVTLASMAKPGASQSELTQSFGPLDLPPRELAWEDMSELASAYFGGNATLSNTGVLNQLNCDAASAARADTGSTQSTPGSHSDHFAYSDNALRWNPTPAAPEISKNTINASIAAYGYEGVSAGGTCSLREAQQQSKAGVHPCRDLHDSSRSQNQGSKLQHSAKRSTATDKAALQNNAQRKFRLRQKVCCNIMQHGQMGFCSFAMTVPYVLSGEGQGSRNTTGQCNS